MTTYYFTPISRNQKTGPMPVVTAPRQTCPSDCALKGSTCYAEFGPLALLWNRVSDGDGLTFSELIKKIKRLRTNTAWRYAQAGDLPNSEDEILQLAQAARHTKVIVYSHKRMFNLFRKLQDYGMYVNLSASTEKEADELSQTGLPVTLVLPSWMGRDSNIESLKEYRDRLGGKFSFKTCGGAKVAICPATYLDTNCAECMACSKPRPGGAIIGFPAHGTRKRSFDSMSEVRSKPWNRVKSSTLSLM